MIVRPKTKTRLIILLCGLFVLGSGLGGAFVIRKAQTRRDYRAKRETGMARYNAGDYPGAIVNLASYIKRFPEDAEATYYLAQSYTRVESPDGFSNLHRAKGQLQRYVQMKPEHIGAWRDLASLFFQLGYNTEAADAAERALADKSDDLEMLRLQTESYFALREYDKALDTYNKRAGPVATDDLRLRVTVLHAKEAKKLDRDEILSDAAAYLDRHPSDGRGCLLVAEAYLTVRPLTSPQLDRAWQLVLKHDPDLKLLRNGQNGPAMSRSNVTGNAIAAVFARKAAQTPTLTSDETRLLVGQFDRLGLFSESVAALEKTLAATRDAALERILIGRLWDAGRIPDVLRRLDKHDPTATSASGVELSAIKALCLLQLGRSAEVAPIAAALSNMKDHPTAQAWAAVIEQASRPDPLKLVGVITHTLESLRGVRQPYLSFYLGDAYAALDERNQAIDAYRQATAFAPLWVQPRLRLSRLLLDDGDLQAALAEARAAAQLMPSIPILANVAVVWAASLDSSSVLRETQLLKLVEFVQQAMPGEEQTLPLYVVLLSKSGKKPAAIEAIKTRLAATTQPSMTALLNLAKAARDADLGADLRESCFAAAEKAHGVSPDLVYARAIDLHLNRKPADATRLLETAMQQHATAQDLSWKLMWARYLDDIGDARAATAWKALADDAANAAKLPLQRAALRARSVQNDRDFMTRTIERIRALTGEQAAGWRVARARMLLNDPDPNLNDVIPLLSEVVKAAPGDLEARGLLAAAHERAGNAPAAIDQLSSALQLQRGSIPIMLDLARLYQDESDFERAGQLLEDVPTDVLPSAQRIQLAMRWLRQGSPSRALDLMEQQPPESAEPATQLFLAELYMICGMSAKAEALYTRMLNNPSAPVIAAAARFYAGSGRKDEAEKALRLLDSVKADAATRALVLAAYQQRYGSPDQAARWYREATKAQPTSLTAHAALILHYVNLGQMAEALAATDEALKNIPGNRVFQAFKDNSGMLTRIAAQKGLLPLVSAILTNFKDRETVIKALEILDDGLRNKLSAEAMVDKMRPLADGAPRLVPLQLLMLHNYRNLGRVKDAATVALRLSRAAPASADTLKLCAQTLAEARDWQQALVVASQWRQLSMGEPLAADIFIADLHLRRGDAQLAERQLAGHLAAARDKPDANAPVLILQAQIFIRGGQAPKAAELLAPQLASSQQWRAIWMELAVASIGDITISSDWLSRVAGYIPEDATGEHVALANFWYEVAKRPGAEKLKENGRNLLARIAPRCGNDPIYHFGKAVLDAQDGNVAEAEAGYRRAVALNPKLDQALNNLAVLLAENNGDLKEALDFARRAVELRPDAATYLDTLAFVQRKSRDYPGAVASLSAAIQREPRNVLWRVNLASAHQESGNPTQVTRVLADIDRILPDQSRLDKQLRQRIEQLRAKSNTKPTVSSLP